MMYSCKSKEQKDTSTASIDEENFCSLLADVQLLETTYSLHFQKADSSRKQMAAHYDQVFSKHGVTREEFEESLGWYAAHPDEMDKIYEKVSAILAKQQADLTNQKVNGAIVD